MDKGRADKETPNGAYSLYTENIVEKPSVKYHRFIRFMEVVFCAAVFGAVAGLVFACVVNYLQGIGEQEDAKRAGIVIEKDEYPSETSGVQQEEGDLLQEQYASESMPQDALEEDITSQTSSAELLQQTMEDISRMVVKVSGGSSFQEMPFLEETTCAGVVFAEVDNEYLLLTRYDEVSQASSITVRIGDQSDVTGYYVKGDYDTGIAIVSIKESDMPSSAMAYIKTANLGNSYNISQGEQVIASGRVMGADFAVNTGITTNVIDKESIVDAYVGLIHTNMVKLDDDYGFLFDMNGNLIGIPVNADNKDAMTFYGISDLKAMIEEISNGYTVTYCGVIGENVTSSLSMLYGLPVGAYITNVQFNSPAYQAGLQAGDVITSVNDEAVLTFSSFSEKIYKLNGGDKATINVKRRGKDEYRDILFSVTLGNKE